MEKVTSADPSVTYPAYANLLAVLADPGDEEHASMLEWAAAASIPTSSTWPAEFAGRLRPSEDEGLALAYEELRAVRAERPGAP